MISSWWPRGSDSGDAGTPATPAQVFVDRGAIGVTGTDGVDGVLLTSIVAGSPAAKAGLRVGDLIIAVDGRNVNKSREMPYEVARRKPGSQIKLRVRRDGWESDVVVNVGDYRSLQK
jgi:S1-C subfamily serine protease